MTTIAIKKSKTLGEQLRLIPIGTTIFVSDKNYRTTTVRKVVAALNKRGYNLVASEIKVVGGINVTRNK